MRLIRRHDNGLTVFQVEGFTRDDDLGFAFHHVNQRIERRSVLAQFLPGVEGEQGYVASVRFSDLAADNGSGLVADQFGQVEYFWL